MKKGRVNWILLIIVVVLFLIFGILNQFPREKEYTTESSVQSNPEWNETLPEQDLQALDGYQLLTHPNIQQCSVVAAYADYYFSNEYPVCDGSEAGWACRFPNAYAHLRVPYDRSLKSYVTYYQNGHGSQFFIPACNSNNVPVTLPNPFPNLP